MMVLRARMMVLRAATGHIRLDVELDALVGELLGITMHADAMPWQWTPQHVDEWSADPRAVHGCVRSTLRNHQSSA